MKKANRIPSRKLGAESGKVARREGGTEGGKAELCYERRDYILIKATSTSIRVAHPLISAFKFAKALLHFQISIAPFSHSRLALTLVFLLRSSALRLACPSGGGGVAQQRPQMVKQ